MQVLTFSSDRKSRVLNSNAKAVAQHGKTVLNESKVLATKLDEFMKTTSHQLQKVRSDAQQFQKSELEALAAHSDRMTQQLLRMQDALEVIQSQDKTSQEAIGLLKGVVKDAGEGINEELKSWSETLEKKNAAVFQQVEESGTTSFSAVNASSAWMIITDGSHRQRRH